MNDYVIDVDRVSIRFNLASEKVDNLKEYAIKLMKHELMFQEFLALQDVSLKVKGRVLGADRYEWLRKIHAAQDDQRNSAAI